ncbi:MAG TPA: hypothetical protein VFS76_05585 [Pyrinomonadaceae bacterium]|nr:hypothetical protein [Pyrinomonadaceae bacterium]
MKERQCEVIRRELDDLTLGDEGSTAVTQHLRECGECREFHQKQTRLRQIVGSLGTVEAPPDFDFRLRARLANESSSAGFHLRAFQWSSAKGFAAVAMLLVFVGGVVYVRTISNPPAGPVAVQREEPVKPPVKPVEDKVVAPVQPPQVALNEVSDTVARKGRGTERVVRPQKRTPVSMDFSSERAETISNSSRQSTIFPIDASQQSFTVSLDDGRGNARTISLPTISFGSQRVIPTRANQFTQKGVWY